MYGLIESLFPNLVPALVEKLFLLDKGEEELLKLLKNFPRFAKEVIAAVEEFEVGWSLIPPFIIIIMLLSSVELSIEALELEDSIIKSL